MAGRTVKSLTISLPVEMAAELDRLSQIRNRSRSDLLREAFRRYVAVASEQQIPTMDPEPGELEALELGREQTARGEFVALEDLLDDLGGNRCARGGKKSRQISD